MELICANSDPVMAPRQAASTSRTRSPVEGRQSPLAFSAFTAGVHLRTSAPGSTSFAAEITAEIDSSADRAQVSREAEPAMAEIAE